MVDLIVSDRIRYIYIMFNRMFNDNWEFLIAFCGKPASEDENMYQLVFYLNPKNCEHNGRQIRYS